MYVVLLVMKKINTMVDNGHEHNGKSRLITVMNTLAEINGHGNNGKQRRRILVSGDENGLSQVKTAVDSIFAKETLFYFFGAPLVAGKCR